VLLLWLWLFRNLILFIFFCKTLQVLKRDKVALILFTILPLIDIFRVKIQNGEGEGLPDINNEASTLLA
jgi:hypothetical protein